MFFKKNKNTFFFYCFALFLFIILFLHSLASSMLPQKPVRQEQPAETPEIQSSIKEVTSAIVHYVNDQTNRSSRSRSASPNTR